ncbi:MAG: hypothetical protein R3Y63_06620 [Eubacteriales bacterium]
MSLVKKLEDALDTLGFCYDSGSSEKPYELYVGLEDEKKAPIASLVEEGWQGPLNPGSTFTFHEDKLQIEICEFVPTFVDGPTGEEDGPRHVDIDSMERALEQINIKLVDGKFKLYHELPYGDSLVLNKRTGKYNIGEYGIQLLLSASVNEDTDMVEVVKNFMDKAEDYVSTYYHILNTYDGSD